ncbi:MAG: pantetheine-phosphate adenylyltransferase [Chlamydiota bacterium]
MSAVIYPGTFDPPHLGHLNIIERLVTLFDRIEVAVGYDSEKPKSLFSLQERKDLLSALLANYPNLSVTTFSTLLIDHAKKLGCNCIVRAVCNLADYEREKTLAFANKQMSGIETLFLFPDPPFQLIRSSVIRDIASRGCSLKDFIPQSIELDVARRLNQRS